MLIFICLWLQTNSGVVIYTTLHAHGQQTTWTSIGHKYSTKTKLPKTYKWYKGSEIMLLGNWKNNSFYIFKIKLIAFCIIWEGREEAGVHGENPHWPVKSLTLVIIFCQIKGLIEKKNNNKNEMA